ncbi:rod-binding protein [Brevundimonas sp. BR2-1]|uniref:rod-binding protein n=1 Tax=Brevundimonas sp. BR2-1 TaxID=3031123 RepID=UPI0030A90300
MNELSIAAGAAGLLQPVVGAGARVVTDKMRATAEAFEASFLSQMMKPMFEGLSTDGMFGGGEAEGTWRGFLVDAMARQTVKAGGVGLADQVVAQMLKMQEAQEPAA